MSNRTSISNVFGMVLGGFGGITLVILLLVVPIIASLFGSLLMSIIHAPSTVSFLLYCLLCACMGIATGFYPAIAFSRFIIRIWPINASGIIRKGCVRWQKIAAITFGILLSMAIFGSFIGQRDLIIDIQNPASYSSIKYQLAFVGAWFGWLTILVLGFGISSWKHTHPTYFQTLPFILFLRRFSSFADRTIISEILKATPSRKYILFIASPQSVTRNWDPFVWAFSGLKFLHPFKSIPIQLRTSDQNWKDTIKDLIPSANKIVMDITDASNSIEIERQMVLDLAKPDNIIWLIEHESKPTTNSIEKLSSNSVKNILSYKRKWSIKSLIFKIFSFMFVGYALYFWIFAIPTLAGGQEQLTIQQFVLLIAFVLIWVLIGVVLIFRQSINKEARKTIRNKLADTI